MRPLTIFHLNGERGIRGGERQLLYLADYLRRRGHRNIIVCRKDHPLDLETRSHNLDTLYLPFLNEWDPLSAWKLRRELKKFKRPIVHAHTSHAAALAFLAAQGTDAIKVVHRRVDFPVNNSLSLRLKYLSADKIITVSKMIKDIFLQQGIESESIDVAHDSCPQHYIEVVYSGVNPQLIQKREQTKHRQTLAERFHLNFQDIWIGNLAALVPHKNQKTLIEAMPIVTSKIPNVHLLLAGEGPEHKKLIRLRRRLNLDTRVHFLGFQKEPFHILQSLDLFVLASWGEGMGSVLLEAM
ncbi:MAG: glycosyltransferase, partial [Elusimicrobia bacterium]|nr:glycosyltransferase [Elusimicrobiota bacterium]